MRYSFTCPASGCNFTIEVEARDDEEAVKKIVSEGMKHSMSDHPDMPSMPESEMINMVRAGMKKK